MDIILLIVLVVVAILLFLAELFIVPGISIASYRVAALSMPITMLSVYLAQPSVASPYSFRLHRLSVH